MTVEPDYDRAMKERYETDASFQFYLHALGGGGASIHYGIYESELTTMSEASEASSRLLLHMAKYNGLFISSDTHILDSGSGNGVCAHFLARETGAKVTCLNLCTRQNEENKRIISSDRVLSTCVQEIVQGTFDMLPESWTERFDVIWSQEAFLHSKNKIDMLTHAWRVLKPHGFLVFTDTMADVRAKPEDVAILASRMRVETLWTLEQFESALTQTGFDVLESKDQTEHVPKVYEHMKKAITGENRKKLDKCSDEFIQGILSNLNTNLKVLAERPAQSWQFVVAKKKNI